MTAALLNLIAANLAPLFLAITANDLEAAKAAARETIEAYQPKDNAELLAVGQSIGHGMAAIASSVRSMQDSLPDKQKLAFRRAATASTRSAETSRKTFQPPPPAKPRQARPKRSAFDQIADYAAEAMAAETMAGLFASKTAPETTDDKTPERRANERMAIAMVKEASDITAMIPTLPPEEREDAKVQAAALTRTANTLLTGQGMDLEELKRTFEAVVT